MGGVRGGWGDLRGEEGGTSNGTFLRAALRHSTALGSGHEGAPEPFLWGQEREPDVIFQSLAICFPQSRGSLGCCLKGREPPAESPALCQAPHWALPRPRTQLKHPRPHWTGLGGGGRALQPAHRSPRVHVPQTHGQGRHGAGLTLTGRAVFTPQTLVLSTL